ncbi:hypothetical protein MPTK1_7g17090 [Marchantia polymorpha subsp. ruderalis]|uniref:DUF7906 domain-containing protein n=2 Tax=Marchantia polymorpha TaxID=3197 RepID=A0AAF6C0N2_MARPO|nr:hypothetical protein MARPO_0051s0046 [Marchantia polymorpha]BBN17816.1 hypothetical protein Mp_7g17090 [Marchantia polymorpha subsp. ruderalis]|eukprot:PTQ38442.1 hypothetical protein MARPO_0051s0046 [Marchantia polymorpha]
MPLRRPDTRIVLNMDMAAFDLKGSRAMLASSCFMILILCQTWKVAGSSGYGLDSALNQAQSDPLADDDIFLSLSPALKNFLVKNPNFDTNKKVQALAGFESTTVINVKLVGFPGDDDRSKQQLETQLSRYIDALNQELRVSVIGSEPHELMVKTKITVEVTRVGRQLTDKVYSAVKAHLDLTPPAATGTRLYYNALQAVPHTVVDDIIQADLEKPLSSYVVYILNTRAQDVAYGYEYGTGSQSNHYPKCLGTFWTGKDRYMWIDIAAGPVEYGPSTSGEGYVKDEMFPSSQNYGVNQFHTVLMADLAAMIWSAARLLFVPAVRIPVSFEQDTEVHLIHIQGANTTEDSKGIDLKLIEEAFMQEKENLLLPQQKLRFKYFNLKFATCPICAAALARAHRTFTARVFLERYSLFVDDYLDSKQLHEFLSEFGAELEEKMQIDAEPSAHVLPVYILDVDSDRQLLLDRYHQVIPFRDMVIAVRSKQAQVVTEYSCNGRPMVAQTRMLERPIVGALLQTLWGVAPTHLTWSAQHNSSLVDYRWAVGQTPFGPFSDSMSLSFAQRDAAPRNVLYSMLNQSISTALDLLETIKVHGGEKNLFGQKRHVEFLQRWNLFMYKLERAVSTISHFDFKTGLYFLKSAEHDLFAVHNLAYTASGDFEATMICYKDPPFPWVSIFSFLLFLGGVAFVWLRRDRIFVNKKKRF